MKHKNLYVVNTHTQSRLGMTHMPTASSHMKFLLVIIRIKAHILAASAYMSVYLCLSTSNM